MTEWLSGALFLAGAALALLAGVGVLRMPDVFTRMQASTKASTLGLGCLLAGLAVRHPEASFVVRAATIAAFMMLTSAVAAHVIASSSSPAPDTMSDAFDVLAREGVIQPALAERLKQAVGFRNIAVHQYKRIDWAIVHGIARTRLGDFAEFARAVTDIQNR